jgi:hypothetical protein
MQLISLIRLLFSSRTRLIAENLFLRKQLALFQERRTKPRRATAGTHLAMIALAKFFNWREALVVIKPDTFIRWHRTAFRKFWTWKSRRRGLPQEPSPPYIYNGSGKPRLGPRTDCQRAAAKAGHPRLPSNRPQNPGDDAPHHVTHPAKQVKVEQLTPLHKRAA